jgi:hypothetical protein
VPVISAIGDKHRRSEYQLSYEVKPNRFRPDDQGKAVKETDEEYGHARNRRKATKTAQEGVNSQ